MDGMRFVVTVAQPINVVSDIFATVPVPCACQLVGVMVSQNGNALDGLTLGYEPPDGDQSNVDEGICYGPLPLSSRRYWNYDEFQGGIHDGSSPFPLEAGSTIYVSSDDEGGTYKFIALVFVEG